MAILDTVEVCAHYGMWRMEENQSLQISDDLLQRRMMLFVDCMRPPGNFFAQQNRAFCVFASRTLTVNNLSERGPCGITRIQ